MIELGPGANLFRMVSGLFWLIIAAQTRRAEAENRFQEHCKKAGEFIYKTADNVEGFLLMKVRPKENNFGEQFMMDDPYGEGWGNGEAQIGPFLHAKDERGFVDSEAVGGHRHVDIIDPMNGKRYRYTGRLDQPSLRDQRYAEWARVFILDKTLAPAAAPRYGLAYDDISTRENREYWIAGSALRVIDLQTNEVLAERIGYMMDPGQGGLGQGGSHPAWDRARDHACPANPSVHRTRNFVEKAIKPIQEK